MNPMTKRTLPLFLVFALALLFGVVGCSKSGKVTGTVTYDGKTVPVGRITFHPEKGNPVSAEIEDGSYTVQKVPSGPVTVTVDTTAHRSELKTLKQGGGMKMPGGGKPPAPPKDAPAEMQDMETLMKERLKKLENMVDVPADYADAKKSGLTYTIQSGSQEINIDIKKK